MITIRLPGTGPLSRPPAPEPLRYASNAMTDPALLIVLILIVIAAALSVGLGVYSLQKRRKCRQLCLQAEQAAEQGRKEDSLNLLVLAERSWALNSHDGSNKSSICDFEVFLRILNQLTNLNVDSTEGAPLTRVRSSIDKMVSILSDRSNFGIDGRMMKGKAIPQWISTYDEFKESRRLLRKQLEIKSTIRSA